MRHVTKQVLRKMGLQWRLNFLLVGVVFLVLLIMSLYLLRVQAGDLRQVMDSNTRSARENLRTKGLTLARNAALASTRALAVRDYLFLVEIINNTVASDEQIVYGIIIDKDRRAIVHTNAALAGASLSGPADLTAAAAKDLDTQELTIDGEQVLEVMAPIVIDRTRWGTVRFGLSLAQLQATIQDNERILVHKTARSIAFTLGVTLATLFVSTLLGISLVRRTVLDPLGALTDGVLRVGDGVLDHPLKIRGSPEFVNLARVFNSMSDTVAQRNAALREANDVLETRVRERTAELTQINTTLADEVARRTVAERELHRYAAKLQYSNRELADFAFVASHDLQEPLRKVQSFGDRLRSTCGDALGEKGLDYLTRMQDASRRMALLISGLLDYSRVTTQAKPFVATDLRQIVTEVLSDLEVRVEAVHARINVESLPTIDADPLQMRQLMQNLIGNALKFQPPGQAPVVTICGRNAGDVVEITVQDNGIGFDEKYAEKIFVVFQRLHGRNEYPGTGIGLAVCRRIAERHGGTLTARSTFGSGATFTATLPCRQPTGEETHG